MWQPCREGKEEEMTGQGKKWQKRETKADEKNGMVAEREMRHMKEKKQRKKECEGPLISSCPCLVRAEKP